MKRVGVRSGGGLERSQADAPGGADVMDESWMDYTLDELREFLEADVLEVRADPEFKERLRRKLWDLVLTRSGARAVRDEDF